MDYSYALNDVKGNTGVSQGDDPFEAQEREAKEQEIKNLEKRGQGYVALGYSTNTSATEFWFWSHPLKKTVLSNDNTLSKKIWLQAMAGVEYVRVKWSVEKFDKKGESEGEVFSIGAATEELITAAQAAGPWSPQGHVRGLGAWPDGTGGLIVNCADGLYRVDGSQHETHERCTTSSKYVYNATSLGSFSEEEATVEEVKTVCEEIVKSWIWQKETDGYMCVGWLLMQPYCGALEDGRANMYITGQTGAGKTFLQKYFKSILDKWALFNRDSREVTVAGLRQFNNSDAVTLLLDEAEPKQGVSDAEYSKANEKMNAILQLLRSAYSQGNDGSFSSIKGSAKGVAKVYDMRISAMFTGISESRLEQADRNRFLRLSLKRLPRDEHGKLPPSPKLRNAEFGARVYRRMWSRWPQFNELRKKVMDMIKHDEERMRMTLAGPIAAILLATDGSLESQSAKDLLAMINADYCGEESLDDATPDSENALQRLLDLTMRVQRSEERALPVECPLADVITTAVREGAGSKGRGAGGDYASALRAKGMTVNCDEEGHISLFLADKHIELEKFSHPVGFLNLTNLLRQVPGAVPTVRKGPLDTRVRLGVGGPRAGVWVPTGMNRSGK